MSEPEPQRSAPPSRPPFQFRLWTLLFVGTVGSALAVAIAYFLFSSNRGDREWIDTTIMPAGTIFRYTVAEPLSITAAEIQGGGDTWQGYSVWLRFRPSKPLIEVLKKNDYTETPLDDVVWRFNLDPQFQGRFSPPWDAAAVKHARCFTRQSKSQWSTSGKDYFLVDEDTGIVYFYGIGS